MTQDLSSFAAELRLGGGDTTAVEVKAAAGGLPESLAPTLSALANLPGGGTIILGLDERAGFQPVPLTDPQALKQGLAAKARGFLQGGRLRCRASWSSRVMEQPGRPDLVIGLGGQQAGAAFGLEVESAPQLADGAER